MAATLLHDQAKRDHALRGGGRSCRCCTDLGSTKSGPKNRQAARQRARQIEKRQWKAES